ncbi:MAG: hypothetical protein K5651_05470 [Bacteroidales bacterium]|nr:hypothetical protein [Bacteroidales bacterium]
MANYFSIAMLLAGMWLAAACTSSEGQAAHDFQIKKVTDYLYEATVDYDLDYGVVTPTFENFRIKKGACSAVTIGNLTGRNLDWNYDDGAEFVIRTTKSDKRHASIGVSSLTVLPNEQVEDGKYHKEFEIIPFLTLDGINDAGILVTIFVVGYQQMGPWEMKNDDPSDDMFELLGPRLILDNCAYLSDIVPLYEKYDWLSLGNVDEFHIMVKGPRSSEDKTVTTAVFEQIPYTEGGKTTRRLCCISQDEKNIVLVGNDPARFHKIKEEDFMVIANFNLWKFDPSQDRIGRLKTASPAPMGFERYEDLELAAQTALSVAGSKENVTPSQMQDIMRTAYYSNCYNLLKSNFWYTDRILIPTKEELLAATEDQLNPCGDINKLIKGKDNKYLNSFKEELDTWAHRDRTAKQNIWETLHTSIYDYENRTLQVNVHEGTIFYDYKL